MANATTYWAATGTTAAAYTTDGNWSGSHPDTDDIGIFDERSSTPVAAVDDSATDIQRILVTPGYTGNIGGAGGSLILAVSNQTTLSAYAEGSSDGPRIDYYGRGVAYFGAGGNGIDRIRVNTQGQFWLTAGTTARVEMAGGTLNIGASAVVTRLVVSGGNVLIEDNATAITELDVLGGTVYCRRDIATYHVGGTGTLYMLDDAATTTVAELNSPQARVFDQSSGTVALLRAKSGLWTPQGNPSDAKTVTALNEFPGSKVIRYATGTTVTISGETQQASPPRDSSLV